MEGPKLPNPRPGPAGDHQGDEQDSLLIAHLQHHEQHPERLETRKLTDKLQSSLEKEGCNIGRIVLALSKAPNIGGMCKKHKLEDSIGTDPTTRIDLLGGS